MTRVFVNAFLILTDLSMFVLGYAAARWLFHVDETYAVGFAVVYALSPVNRL